MCLGYSSVRTDYDLKIPIMSLKMFPKEAKNKNETLFESCILF